MSRCSSWSERSGAFGGNGFTALNRWLAPGRSQLVRVGSVSRLAPTVRYGIGKTSSSACGSVQFNGNLQTVDAPNATSRFIDFFNSFADASITKSFFARSTFLTRSLCHTSINHSFLAWDSVHSLPC
jgi:hypothetical protein